MNARDRLRIMIRSDRGSMTVWSQPEIDDAFAAYDAERRAEAFNEAAAILQDRAAQYPTRRIFAAGLRHGALRLAKEAMGRTSRQAADFFQPGRTYAREHHAATIRFLVRFVDESPEGNPYRVAFGWRTEDGDVCPSPFDSDDFTGWTDVTEGVSR